MLTIRGLTAGYGHCQALFGVDLDVGQGEVVGLIGRNGMGRSTVIKCLFGLLPASQGSIQYGDRSLRGMAPYRIGRLGLLARYPGSPPLAVPTSRCTATSTRRSC